MEYVCSIKTKSQPFSFILLFISVPLMEDSTLAANRNHCNFCHDRMAKWRKLKVRIFHWACLHFFANPHEKHVLWYPSTKFWQTDPAPWYRLLETTERYWKCVFFHTHYTTIYPHTHHQNCTCLYLPGFLSPKLPQKSMGGPAQTTVRPKPEGWFGAKRRRLGPAGKTGGVWTKGTPRATNKAWGGKLLQLDVPWDPWRIRGTNGKNYPTNENQKLSM